MMEWFQILFKIKIFKINLIKIILRNYNNSKKFNSQYKKDLK